MCVSVCVNLVQLLVGNQIEHCAAMSADTSTAIVSILIEDRTKELLYMEQRQ